MGGSRDADRDVLDPGTDCVPGALSLSIARDGEEHLPDWAGRIPGAIPGPAGRKARGRRAGLEVGVRFSGNTGDGGFRSSAQKTTRPQRGCRGAIVRGDTVDCGLPSNFMEQGDDS